MKTQKTKIKEHLICNKAITPIDALNKFGCFRLAARISELREEGLNIKTSIISPKKGNRYAKYSII